MYHEMKEEENESMYHKHESSQDFEPETLKETLTSGFTSDAMSGSIEMGKSAQHKRNFTVDTATSVVIPSNTSLHFQSNSNTFSFNPGLTGIIEERVSDSETSDRKYD